MTFTPSNGSKLYVGTAVDETTDTQSEFEAITWTEVRGVTNLGEFGDSSSDISSTELNNNRVMHAKGAVDGGTPAFVCNNYPSDPGQQAMYAAELSPSDYAFKITYNDKKTTSGTPSTRYFRGKVMSTRESVGSANNPITVTFNTSINSDLIRVAAT